MSRISRIKLTNYCQHRDLEVHLRGNLIGVVGDNASGKTNLTSSVAAAITGVFPKKKSGMITYGEKKGSVEVELQTNDSGTTVISRDLHGSGCSLEATDPAGNPLDWSPMTNQESVNSMMSEIFPYPAAVLKGVIFTPQESITSLLFDPKSSVRERMAMSFFGIEKAEEVEAEVAKVLSDIPIQSTPVDYVPAKEIKKNLLPQKRKELVALEKKQSDLEAKVKKLEDDVSNFNREKASPAKEWIKYNEASSREASLIGAISPLGDEILELKKSIAEKEYSLDGTSAKDLTDRLQDSKALEAAEAEMGSAIAEVQEMEGEDAPPDTTERMEEIADEVKRVRTEVVSTSNDIAKHEELIRARKMITHGTNDEECPTCLRAGLTDEDVEKISRAVESTPEKIKSLEKKVRSLQKKEGDLREELQELKSQAAKDKRDLEVAKIRAEKAVALVDKTKAHIIDRWGVVTSSSKISKVLEAVNTMEGAMRHEAKALKEKELKIVRLEEELESIRAKDAPDNPLGLASAHEAMEIIEEFEILRGEFYDARSLISPGKAAIWNIQSDVQDLEKNLTAFEKFETERAKAEEARRVVSAVRAVFHYSAAPKKVVSARLKAVSKRINAYLEAFESEFIVDAREGFDFDCVFGGRVLGKIMTPQDLSGGEKVALSVAFRLAAAETFCSGVGFLVLDEPTVWMDKKRIGNIPRVMEKLSRISEETGTQYIVVTHDTRLMGCFDQIVELEPENNE